MNTANIDGIPQFQDLVQMRALKMAEDRGILGEARTDVLNDISDIRAEMSESGADVSVLRVILVMHDGLIGGTRGGSTERRAEDSAAP